MTAEERAIDLLREILQPGPLERQIECIVEHDARIRREALRDAINAVCAPCARGWKPDAHGNHMLGAPRRSVWCIARPIHALLATPDAGTPKEWT